MKSGLVFEDMIEVKVVATLTDQWCHVINNAHSIRCTGVILGFANLLAYFQLVSKRNY